MFIVYIRKQLSTRNFDNFMKMLNCYIIFMYLLHKKKLLILLLSF